MGIHILCVGTLKEPYWRDAAAEYGKRLRRYCEWEIDDIKETRTPDRASPAEETAVRAAEGKALLRRIPKDSYVIALDMHGAALDSEAFAEKLETLSRQGKGRVAFLIGGSLGLSEEVRARADFQLSFSKMTFPHQMMRVVLLEQLYRGFKILRNETYHK
jgi:23S rRNA (pseudouridine1915-N3)-methyltransferase